MKINKTIVYKTTNLVNGKYYIGTHRCGKQPYCKSGRCRYLGSGILLQDAVKKYGRDKFIRETLFEFDFYEDAITKEEELVTRELIIDNDCYNIHLGGGYNEGYDKDKLELFRNNSLGENNPMFGKRHSQKTKDLISRIMTDMNKDKNYTHPSKGKRRGDLSERNRIPTKFMNNGIIQKKIRIEDIAYMETCGFSLGMLDSKSKKGKPFEKVKCEYCGIEKPKNSIWRHKIKCEKGPPKQPFITRI